MEPCVEAAALIELSPRSKARKARRDYKEKQKEADPEGWKLKRAAEAKTTYENKKARLAASALATVGSSTTPEGALPAPPPLPPNQPPTPSLPLLPPQPDAALQLTPPPPHPDDANLHLSLPYGLVPPPTPFYSAVPPPPPLPHAAPAKPRGTSASLHTVDELRKHSERLEEYLRLLFRGVDNATADVIERRADVAWSAKDPELLKKIVHCSGDADKCWCCGCYTMRCLKPMVMARQFWAKEVGHD